MTFPPAADVPPADAAEDPAILAAMADAATEAAAAAATATAAGQGREMAEAAGAAEIVGGSAMSQTPPDPAWEASIGEVGHPLQRC